MCALIFLLANYTQQGAELVFEPKTLYSRTYYSYHQGFLYYMKMPLLLRYRLYIPQQTCQKLNSSQNPLERFFFILELYINIGKFQFWSHFSSMWTQVYTRARELVEKS